MGDLLRVQTAPVGYANRLVTHFKHQTLHVLDVRQVSKDRTSDGLASFHLRRRLFPWVLTEGGRCLTWGIEDPSCRPCQRWELPGSPVAIDVCSMN